MTAPAPEARLEEACARLVADGTDPAVVAAVLGWSVRPRRTPDALRRACRDATAPPPESARPAVRLGEIARPAVTRDDRRAALAVARRWEDLGVRVALVGDPAYPPRLAEGWPHTDGPVLLAWRGSAPGAQPSVAIVGARRASSYGTGVAAWLAEAVSRAGARVVSGGAVGIDAAAHRAALEGPGGTTVVLGCGHGVAYPRTHARPDGLFDAVLDEGGTLASELLPDEPPRAWQVRARNRLVAGLVDVVVVVEGGPRSGALLTASAAAEKGRVVLAVPGDVRAPGSAAPHRLLADGAGPCTEPADLLDALRLRAAEVVATPGHGGAPSDERPNADAGETCASTLPAAVHARLVAIWPRAVRVDELARDSGVAVPALLAALTRAQIAGEVVQSAEGVRFRRNPSGA